MADNEDSAVQDFLEILEEHRKNCERQGKYVEAEIAKNRLDELKLHEENRRREAMRSRQIAERLGVEEAHMLEFQQFNLIWDKKMGEYEAHAEELGLAMKERHAAELRDYQRRLMAKQKDYAEAHKIKLKADALEAWELEKWHSQRQQDLLQKEAKFKHVKQQELIALQKRVQTGREEQKKQRHQDLERLLQRYQNVKAELEAQQNLERIRMEKLVQSGALTSTRKKKSAGH
eukprot:GSChrysophyteH1.ASY1.ANO1.1141.1 assembled CDS